MLLIYILYIYFNFHPPVKLTILNFHPLEVMSCYRDPQLQVCENYSYLFNLRSNICKYSCLNGYSFSYVVFIKLQFLNDIKAL